MSSQDMSYIVGMAIENPSARCRTISLLSPNQLWLSASFTSCLLHIRSRKSQLPVRRTQPSTCQATPSPNQLTLPSDECQFINYTKYTNAPRRTHSHRRRLLNVPPAIKMAHRRRWCRDRRWPPRRDRKRNITDVR